MNNAYARLKSEIASAASEVKRADKKKPIIIIGHLDADGMSAAAILVKALLREGHKYSLYTLQQLDQESLAQADSQNPSLIIVADVGSGQFSLLREQLRKSKVIVLDHHKLDDEVSAQNIRHINPHLFGLDNSKEISGAGLAYLFAVALSKSNKDLAHIAIIGAIADMQDRDGGFLPLNQEILEQAIEQKKLESTFGLRLYGRTTRPLHKVLEFSTDYPIPGVSGSENSSLAFLQEIGISPKDENNWRTMSSLNQEEYQKLIVGVILRRSKLKKPEEILGQVYTLVGEKNDSPMSDVREFATLLNACGRLGKASLGIGALLGDEALKRKAVAQMDTYRKEIQEMMRWVKDKTDEVYQGKGYLIINASDNVLPTMVGTLCSILARSGEIEQGTVVIGLARLPGKLTKVSLRCTGKGMDMFSLSRWLADKVDGKAGGHSEAAGAIISTIKENEFITLAMDRITKTRK